MTPRQKAESLLHQFTKATTFKYQEYAGAHYSTFEHDLDTIKECALITVNEILNSVKTISNYNVDSWEEVKTISNYNVDYWEEVKQEIQIYKD